MAAVDSPLARVSAFGCGVAIALALIASKAVILAEPAPRTLYACVSADGTLQLTDDGVPCVPGERRVRLKPPKLEEERKCEAEDERAERLERRVKDLEYRERLGTLRGRRAVAPFEVVTRSNAKVLTIEEQNVTLFNRDGKPVVWIMTGNDGGFLQTQTAGGDRTTAIEAQGALARVRLQENDRTRVDLGRRANGQYGLQVLGKQDKLIAFIGQSEVGSGLAMVNDTSGSPAAQMFVRRVNGHLAVMNGGGVEVGAISSAGSDGAGWLQLRDGQGVLMVEAGVNPNGQGVVRTGPEMRNFGAGLVGLVPSLIIGKAQ